jgi:CheY-like chemotaxis protein
MKIILIENDPKDFDDIKQNLNDWTIYPESINAFNGFEIEETLKFVLESLSKNNDVDALIVDIALKGDDDKTGLELINRIRDSNESFKNKIIPIFCYSRLDLEKENAFKAGATNFFHKDSLIVESNLRYKYFRQTLKALVFLYRDAIRYAQNLSDFDEINKKLEELHKEIKSDSKIIIDVLFRIMSFDDIDKILQDENSEEAIMKKIGEDKLIEIKRYKLSEEQNRSINENIGHISDILATIPGLTPISGILKAIQLMTKSMK